MKRKKYVVILSLLLLSLPMIFNYNDSPFTEYLVKQKAINAVEKNGDIDRYHLQILDCKTYWNVSLQLNMKEERNKDYMGGTTYVLISKFSGKIIDIVHK